MPEFPIRKIAVLTEEILHEGGPAPANPRRRAAALALVKNPYEGRYVAELQPGMEDLKPLGLMLTDRLIAALGGDVKKIDGYGKGAIVGAAGELEHGALWHVPGGYAMRELLGQALAIVPSSAKLGAMGASIDIPIHHKDAAYVRRHFDAITASVPDAPRADEIMFVLAMTTGGRPPARVGGLKASEISKWDGQR